MVGSTSCRGETHHPIESADSIRRSGRRAVRRFRGDSPESSDSPDRAKGYRSPSYRDSPRSLAERFETLNGAMDISPRWRRCSISREHLGSRLAKSGKRSTLPPNGWPPPEGKRTAPESRSAAILAKAGGHQSPPSGLSSGQAQTALPPHRRRAKAHSRSQYHSASAENPGPPRRATALPFLRTA